jgi:hypothetical protein
MSLYTVRKQICVYTKTSVGAFGATSSTPAPSTVLDVGNVIQVYEPMSPMQLGMFDRNPARPRTGSLASVPGTQGRTFTCRAELKSSGTPGVPAKHAPLFKACGLTQTINTGSAAIGSVVADAKAGAVDASKPTIAGTFGGAKSGTMLVVITGVVTDTSITFTAIFRPGDGTAQTVYAGEIQNSATAVTLSGGDLDAVTVDFGDPSSSTSGFADGNMYYAALTSDQEESVSYAMAEKPTTRADIAVLEDGRVKSLRNAMGTCSIRMVNGEPAFAEFTFTGVDAGEQTDQSMYTAYVTDELVPDPILNCDPTLGGTALQPWTEFSFDQGNNVVLIEDATSAEGFEGAEIIGRAPVGSVNPLAQLFAAKNFFTTARAGTEQALALSYGSTGNIITFNAANCQILNVESTDVNGTIRENLSLKFNQPDYDAGGDYTDYKLTFS